MRMPARAKTLYNYVARTAPLAFDITMMKLFLMTTGPENKLYREQQTCRTSLMRHSYIQSKRGSPNSMKYNMQGNREEQATIDMSKMHNNKQSLCMRKTADTTR